MSHTPTSGLLKIYDLNKYGRYNTRVHHKTSETLGGQISLRKTPSIKNGMKLFDRRVTVDSYTGTA